VQEFCRLEQAAREKPPEKNINKNGHHTRNPRKEQYDRPTRGYGTIVVEGACDRIDGRGCLIKIAIVF
jgi:hypothetical protein